MQKGTPRRWRARRRSSRTTKRASRTTARTRRAGGRTEGYVDGTEGEIGEEDEEAAETYCQTDLACEEVKMRSVQRHCHSSGEEVEVEGLLLRAHLVGSRGTEARPQKMRQRRVMPVEQEPQQRGWECRI